MKFKERSGFSEPSALEVNSVPAISRVSILKNVFLQSEISILKSQIVSARVTRANLAFARLAFQLRFGFPNAAKPQPMWPSRSATRQRVAEQLAHKTRKKKYVLRAKTLNRNAQRIAVVLGCDLQQERNGDFSPFGGARVMMG